MLSRRVVLPTAIVGVLSASALTVVALSSAPLAAAATTTITPVADSYVQDSTPTTNYGTSSSLVVDGSPVDRTFLKFTLGGVVDPITNVKLRVHVKNSNAAKSAAGGTLSAVADTTWSETGLTWNNQPAIGSALGSLGSVAKNTWYEFDVTSTVTANGTYSFSLTSANSDDAQYDARETGANAPQLVITTTPPTTTTTTQPGGDPVLVGAGDIANSGSGDTATANLLDGIAGDVFTLGDNAYDSGSTAEYNTYYDPTWGRHKARTHPSPGNHEYGTSGAAGYFGYFGSLAGPSGQGYYSYDLGNWHIVSLDSEIAYGVGSAQETWLRADLAASTKPCTIAYWHRPRFTSGSNHAPDASLASLWQALYDYNADLVLSGHNHQYERFAPMDPNGNADPARGIREFVAGTGGASHYSFGTIKPNSEVRNGDTYGVLKLTLHANSYDFQFVPEAGKTFTDSGTGTCH